MADTPQIKIGIIGTKTIVDRIMKVIASFPTFSPIALDAGSDMEILTKSEQLAEQVEVLLLTDSISYRKVKEMLPVSLPVHHIPPTGAGLYKSLFQAFQSGNRIDGISVDTLTKSTVLRTMKELGLEHLKAVVYDGPIYSSTEKLVAFHRAEADAGRNSFALTGVESVSRELTRQGLPNEWFAPADQDIIVTLERALLSTQSRRGKESQIVVGIIHVDDFDKLIMKRISEHEVQKLKLDIYRLVLGYVESLDGYLTSLGGDEYLFFTTRGILERETGGYKTIHLAKDANSTYGITFSLGIGFGTSANEAGTNARAALRSAKESGGNTCFIVREDRTLIGPLEMADPVQAVLAPTHAELIKRAEDAGMTNAYLSKLLSNMARFGKYEYKVQELASLLDITVRSAHRLLLLWMDNQLVEVAGLEKMPKGRPRQIFRFTFLMDKSF